MPSTRVSSLPPSPWGDLCIPSTKVSSLTPSPWGEGRGEGNSVPIRPNFNCLAVLPKGHGGLSLR